MMKLAGRPIYWFFLQFFPVAGWFITLGILVEFIKVFGKIQILGTRSRRPYRRTVFYLPGYGPEDKIYRPRRSPKAQKRNRPGMDRRRCLLQSLPPP